MVVPRLPGSRSKRGNPLRRGGLLAATALLAALIGVADFLTGWEISFSVFYLIPVSIAAWRASRGAGVALSIACAFIWTGADVAAHPGYSHAAIPLWNGCVRLLIFLVMTNYLSLLRRTLDRQKDLARSDSLTGLANSRAFYEIARTELSRHRRYGRPMSVAYIDVDDFKHVNDACGHLGGDALLRRLAEVLAAQTRATDVVARLGGDEFAILFPEADADQADAAIRKIRSALGRELLVELQPVTVSIGVLTCDVPPDDVEDLVRRADGLMYRAKAQGKNHVRRELLSDDGAGLRVVRFDEPATPAGASIGESAPSKRPA